MSKTVECRIPVPVCCPECGNQMLNVVVDGRWIMHCANWVCNNRTRYDVPMMEIKVATGQMECACGKLVGIQRTEFCCRCDKVVCPDCSTEDVWMGKYRHKKCGDGK